MDDEKNGVDLPENSDPVEEASGADDAAQGDVSGEPTPEEQEMLAMAEADSQDEGGEADDAGESSVSDIPDLSDADGQDQLLSQDDIDNVLGDMADQIGGDEDFGESPGEFLDDNVKQADFQQLSQTSDSQEPRNIELLMDVDLPVSIELGRTRMNISDILSLGPGSIVELDKLVGEPVDLLVNQKCVARGEVVVVEESFGLRITQLVSPEERLKNLQ